MRLVHLDDEVAQHRVAELERVLELAERLVVALDVHEHVVRLVHLLDRVGELAPAPVLEAVHDAVAGGDDALVALDHGGHLLALVGMDDENDLVMSHARIGLLFLWLGPTAMRSGVTRKGADYTPAFYPPTSTPPPQFPAPASLSPGPGPVVERFRLVFHLGGVGRQVAAGGISCHEL